MRAIMLREPGDAGNLEWTEVDDPTARPEEVVLDVAASAVNRADLLQRQGHYPPPQGASDIIGLECSGTIAEVGAEVTGWNVGDEVCALLSGGGYAQKVAVPATQLLPVPPETDLVAAAALPEVACTVWSNVVSHAGLKQHEVLLVHGGSGGIGTHAIQVAKALGATVAVTTGSEQRADRCRQLGADLAINYREQDFTEVLKAETGGADVILDNMGAQYLSGNIAALRTSGRLVVIGMQGGRKAELDLGRLIAKRASIAATTLRARPPEEKARIVADVREQLWPMVELGTVRPVVDHAVPLSNAAEAHRALEAGGVFGKVLLTAR